MMPITSLRSIFVSVSDALVRFLVRLLAIYLHNSGCLP